MRYIIGTSRVFKRLREDIDSIIERDPAARSRFTVALCYPGFHALVMHRLAHPLWVRGWRTFARWLSYLARMVTGIEIHPASTIGRRFFIDHGTGVVIGETAEIGDDVTLYQGVTLGGTALHRGKRHPTLGNGVIVGAGAKVLGPFTVGDHARIGSNAVVVKAVEPGTTVVGIPAKPIQPKTVAPQAFVAYGTPCEDLPDPVARALRGLTDEVTALRHRIAVLEGERRAEGNGYNGDAVPGVAAEDAAMVEGRGSPS